MDDGAVIRTNSPGLDQGRWVLTGRGASDPAAVVDSACGGPPATALGDSARVAGARWAIEDPFELAKWDCGLGESEARSWAGRHRHATPGLFARSVVAVVRSRAAGAAERPLCSASSRIAAGSPTTAARHG